MECFIGCSALKKVNLSNWNTKNVTSMVGMFYNCEALQEIDLSSFDTKNVKDFEWMFNGATALTKIYVGNNWNTENNTGKTKEVFPENCKLPNFSNTNESYRDLKWAYVGEGGYLSTKPSN